MKFGEMYRTGKCGGLQSTARDGVIRSRYSVRIGRSSSISWYSWVERRKRLIKQLWASH
jgi:hypothetical protein